MDLGLNDNPNIKTSLHTISLFGLIDLKFLRDNAQGENMVLPLFLHGVNTMDDDLGVPVFAFLSALPGGCINPLNLKESPQRL